MTDKIMIDGIDVSGCSYGEIEKDIFKCSCEYNVRSASMFCKDNPNCNYKNWKRKEQECEELNKWLPIVTRLEEQFKSHEKAKSIGYKTYAEQVFTELDQLKAENEELKNFHINLVGVKECEIKELLKLKEELAISIQENEEGREINAELKAENNLLRKTHKTEQDRRRAYEQALTEIKEIARKTLNMVDYKTYFKRDNKSIKQEGFKAIEQILQKCEVINEHN